VESQVTRAAVAVVAKEPVAGHAKTRLAPALGPGGAAAAAAAMLVDTLAVVARVDAEPWLCFTPGAARERLAAQAPGFRLLPQSGGDLGDRLAACAVALRAAGAERIAIVGADTPHLRPAWYEAALTLVDQVDLVLGPALDGGYYLVAGREPPRELFVETLRRAERHRLRVALLPPLRDLDRVEDLVAALAAGELDASPCTRAVVAALLDGSRSARPIGGPGLTVR
jgi:rSAM/selenodomain-associated transferase 1